jgi:cubilin
MKNALYEKDFTRIFAVLIFSGFFFNYYYYFELQVTFKNFSLENHPSCSFDYLDILNGRYVSSPSIGKKCGPVVPQPFTSQSNGIRIIFKTDYSVSANGFRIQYRFVTDGE